MSARNSSYLYLREILDRGIGRRPVGRAVGCAEAPQAGLPPCGLPSLTQTVQVSEQPPRPIRSEAASHVLGSGFIPKCAQCLRPGVRSNGNDNFAKQPPRGASTLSLAPDERTTVVLAVNRTSNGSAGPKMCTLVHQASGEGPAPLSNGLSLVLVRPSTINPQGVRYASVRPLRRRLRGDRSRPRTRRRLSSGDGPRRKTGAFKCRTISLSLRTMRSTWPAR